MARVWLALVPIGSAVLALPAVGTDALVAVEAVHASPSVHAWPMCTVINILVAIAPRVARITNAAESWCGTSRQAASVRPAEPGEGRTGVGTAARRSVAGPGSRAVLPLEAIRTVTVVVVRAQVEAGRPVGAWIGVARVVVHLAAVAPVPYGADTAKSPLEGHAVAAVEAGSRSAHVLVATVAFGAGRRASQGAGGTRPAGLAEAAEADGEAHAGATVSARSALVDTLLTTRAGPSRRAAANEACVGRSTDSSV